LPFSIILSLGYAHLGECSLSANLTITGDPEIEEKLLAFLKARKYTPMLGLINTHCLFKFCTEQTGSTFEKCVHWCAQNGSDPPDADKALLLLFSKFYVYLPTPVKERFSRRAAQLEYDPNKTQPHFLMQFIETPRSLFFSGKTALASIMMRVEKCVTNIRLKPSLSRWGGPWVLLEKTLRYRS
jgi:hypothetical protein